MTERFSNWRKSTRSGTTQDNCVEVAATADAVGVRDSKDHGRGPVLLVGPAAWVAFLDGGCGDRGRP